MRGGGAHLSVLSLEAGNFLAQKVASPVEAVPCNLARSRVQHVSNVEVVKEPSAQHTRR
jgi:hypothetical protein